jgi:hypothetical protein
MANFKIGDLVSFTYEPPPSRPPSRVHDKYPQVLVLHPNWEVLMHGLNFNYLSDDVKNTIRMLLDPMFEMKFRDALRNRNPNLFDELEGIITGRSGSGGGRHLIAPPPRTQGAASKIKDINHPRAFYYAIIRPFIYKRGWDPYRKYKLSGIKNARVVTPAAVMLGEESLAKFQKERAEMMARAKKALGEAKTPQDVKIAQEAIQRIDKEKGMSQRKSLLTWFADRLQYWRGPRFK